jgi:hypothetical protein
VDRDQGVPSRTAGRDWHSGYSCSGFPGIEPYNQPETWCAFSNRQRILKGWRSGSCVASYCCQRCAFAGHDHFDLSRRRHTQAASRYTHAPTNDSDCARDRKVDPDRGKRYFPAGTHVPVFSFAIALLISTWSILSIGFLIASIVPTARFAQPLGAIILYPMFAFSGLFVPLETFPPVLRVVGRLLPLTYAVRLLEGIWNGDGWWAHLGDVAALTVFFLLFTAISARVFRWE